MRLLNFASLPLPFGSVSIKRTAIFLVATCALSLLAAGPLAAQEPGDTPTLTPSPTGSPNPTESPSPEGTPPPGEIIPSPTETPVGFVAPTPAPGEMAVIEVMDGNIVIKLFAESAPRTVANFKKLARDGFYEGIAFHRVVPGLLIQAGDPNTRDEDRTNDGLGSIGYQIPPEQNFHRHLKGTVSMALAEVPDPSGELNSDGSQFFICLAPAPFLDGKNTVFGQVVRGFDLVQKISEVERDERNNPLEKIVIQKITIQFEDLINQP